MKAIRLALLALCALFLSAYVRAATTTTVVDGVNYRINGSEAYVAPLSSGFYSGVISIPEYITYNNKSYPVTKIYDSAFANCTELESVIIPSSVTSINQKAFYKSSIKRLSIPATVTSIYPYILCECSSIESLRFEDSDTTLKFLLNESTSNSGYAIKGCTIDSLYIGRKFEITDKSNTYCIFATSAIGNLEFGEKATELCARLFFSGSLPDNSLVLPSWITKIGDKALDVRTLVYLELPASIPATSGSIGSAILAYHDTDYPLTIVCHMTSPCDVSRSNFTLESNACDNWTIKVPKGYLQNYLDHGWELSSASTFTIEEFSSPKIFIEIDNNSGGAIAFNDQEYTYSTNVELTDENFTPLLTVLPDNGYELSALSISNAETSGDEEQEELLPYSLKKVSDASTTQYVVAFTPAESTHASVAFTPKSDSSSSSEITDPVYLTIEPGESGANASLRLAANSGADLDFYLPVASEWELTAVTLTAVEGSDTAQSSKPSALARLSKAVDNSDNTDSSDTNDNSGSSDNADNETSIGTATFSEPDADNVYHITVSGLSCNATLSYILAEKDFTSVPSTQTARDGESVSIALSNNAIRLTGLPADALVAIYSLQGELLTSGRADAAGDLTTELPTAAAAPIYIIRTPARTFKLIR